MLWIIGVSKYVFWDWAEKSLRSDCILQLTLLFHTPPWENKIWEMQDTPWVCFLESKQTHSLQAAWNMAAEARSHSLRVSRYWLCHKGSKHTLLLQVTKMGGGVLMQHHHSKHWLIHLFHHFSEGTPYTASLFETLPTKPILKMACVSTYVIVVFL